MSYLRTATVIAFAAGLALGSLLIAAAATFTGAGAEQLPPCETIQVDYTVAS